MELAITLAARNSSASRIEDLWRAASRFERTPSMLAKGYPPHLTFAIYNGIRKDDLIQVFQAVSSEQPALLQTFHRVDTFDVHPLVLWAAPVGTDALRAIHDQLHRLMDPSHCDPHYRPGMWVPHCTLAVDVAPDRRKEALAYALRPISPFSVRFDAMELVDVSDLTVVRTVALGENSSL
ncbi:MAG: 2'-5' RNA ligase family protein [Pseudomonadota bacterium]